MKVHIFHPSDELYGADRVALEFAKICRSIGHDVTVTLPLDIDYPDRRFSVAAEQEGIRVSRCDFPVLRRDLMRLGGLVSLASRAFKSSRMIRVSAREADLVYISTSASLLCVLPMVGLRRRAKVLVHIHESWTKLEQRILGFLAVFGGDRAFVVSAALVPQLPSRLKEKTTVVHNGFGDLQDRNERNQDDQPACKRTFLVASRWNRWKGHATLAAAWGSGSVDRELLVCGGPPPSGHSVNVPELFEGVSNVRFLGELEDVTSVILNCDVVVVPSDKPDPLPTIALEALRAGKPVIGSDLGGIPEIVGKGDGAAGWLYTAGDASSLSAVLDSLSEAEVRRRGDQGRCRYEALFSLSQFEATIIAKLAEMTHS